MTQERAKPVLTTLTLSLLLISGSLLLPALAEAWNPVMRPVIPRLNRARQQVLIRTELQKVRLRNLNRQLKGQVRKLKRDLSQQEVRQEVQKLTRPRHVLP